MMKKILIVATVVKTHIMQFDIPLMRELKSRGWYICVAAKNDYENPSACNIPFCDKYYDIGFERTPFSFKNIKAYSDLKRIIEKENFDVVHCNTPVGGVIGRLASRKASEYGTKVVYTAHGFHFYKGAPFISWIYYPIEKICSYWTNVLITINSEDYIRAKNTFKADKTIYLPGVGIDINKFSKDSSNKNECKKAFGLSENELVLLSVGELNENKNHEIVIKALSKLKNRDNVSYVIAGDGPQKKNLVNLSEKLGVNLCMLGYRTDIENVYKAADIYILPSKREGLNVSVIEAMASGLPIICSNIRGCVDLINNSKSGILVSPNDVLGFTNAIDILIYDETCRINMGQYNRQEAKKYEVSNINNDLLSMYEDVTNE